MRKRLNSRVALVMLHDGFMTCAAVLLAFFLRFDAAGIAERKDLLIRLLPAYAIYACGIYSIFHLYRSKWRFASIPDLFNIYRAASVLALSLLAADYVLISSGLIPHFFFGKVTLLLYWMLQIFALGGSRLVYRYYRYARAREHGRIEDKTAALLIGSAADADIVLRTIESGTIKHLWVVGLLSSSPNDQGQFIRLKPVLGVPDDLEKIVIDLEQNQQRPQRLVLLPSAFDDPQSVERVLTTARRFNIIAQRLPVLESGTQAGATALRLAPINVEDLLFRDSVHIDYERIGKLIMGQRIIVTGGAGSIGSEICERMVALGAAHLLVLDHSEAALHTITTKLGTMQGITKIETRLADVRDASRLTTLFQGFKPDMVFHAAALKHVPIIEQDWAEGLRTNIDGTVHVCEAALEAGVKIVVVISTDKAVEPVSILGISKRFGELYTAALDREMSAKKSTMRFISVRFGNVLGSSGSVVPLFREQIASGGPVTVTHQAMVRYFMTGREACNLVLTSASHASTDTERAASVYVLDMGHPVRILDLAERMVRLAGYEPGKDILIEMTGARPGERIHEVLFAHGEHMQDIGIEGVSAAQGCGPTLMELEEARQRLARALQAGSREEALACLRPIMPDMHIN